MTATRNDIEFPTEDGLLLRGWHFVPAGDGPFPTIVMAHGITAVKEMGLEGYGAAFAEAGFAALVYDHRNLGASDGQPRQEVDPIQQIRDWRDAITFAETLPETDRERIGVWGSSFAGAHVLALSAWDRRVKCVASQVPALNTLENARRMLRTEELIGASEAILADRRARWAGDAPQYMPVVSDDPAAPAFLPTRDSWEWFSTVGADTRWENRITLRSAELAGEYQAELYIPLISPTPLLMIVATQDILCAPDVLLSAYERALEPKRVELIACGHFDLYAGDGLQTATAHCVSWFAQHLGSH
jgi:fermentation-respiration switch protein FrsA (DUF1100 family)